MAEPKEVLSTLLTEALVASLGVIEDGAPAVSLVAFSTARDPLRFHLLVSDLSSHTPALRADARCSLLVHEPARTDDPNANHALVRVMIKGRARFLSRDEATADGIVDRWRARYAITDTLLGLSDFHFVEVRPEQATFVMGFGRAFRASGDNLENFEHVRPNKPT